MSKSVKIGIFIPGDSQFLDAACIDVLGIMSKEYLGLVKMPAHVVAAAPSVSFFYITTPQQKALGLVNFTSSLKVVPTHDTSDPEVQPGKLDIVFVPGPDPTTSFDKPTRDFLYAHFKVPTTDILSVCTGIYLCCEAGILKERKGSGPRGLQDDIVKRFPGTELVGDKYRWYQDGNYWSSGGITNGNDLMAAYARASEHFPNAVAEIGCKLSDVGDRGQIYGQGQTSFTIGFVWQLLKAYFVRGTPKTD